MPRHNSPRRREPRRAERARLRWLFYYNFRSAFDLQVVDVGRRGKGTNKTNLLFTLRRSRPSSFIQFNNNLFHDIFFFHYFRVRPNTISDSFDPVMESILTEIRSSTKVRSTRYHVFVLKKERTVRFETESPWIESLYFIRKRANKYRIKN